jgi:hypothetical protein
MSHIERERRFRPSCAQLVEGFALPRDDLADVLAELDGQPALDEPEEGPPAPISGNCR